MKTCTSFSKIRDKVLMILILIFFLDNLLIIIIGIIFYNILINGQQMAQICKRRTHFAP